MSYRASIIKSVQRGTITLNNVTSNTATITAVVTANTELRFLGMFGFADTGTRIDKTAVRIDLTNTTTVTATLGSAQVGDMIVGFEVIEYVAGIVKSINRGTLTGNAVTATITAVVTGKTHINNLGFSDTANGAFNNSYVQGVRFTLTDSTTVTQNISAGYSHIGSYEVVEFK